MSAPLRVLIVDDHPLTRDGLRGAIAAQADLEVVGEAATWQTALRLAQELRPAVMVLDLNLPDGNGWSLIDQLKAAAALPPTLVLSVCDEQIYARRLLRSGALGYLMKDEPGAIILQAIRDVAQGRRVTSMPLAQKLAEEAFDDRAESAAESGSALEDLSDREIQLFALLGQGERNKAIAARLGLSAKTVSTYKVRLFRKLGVKTTPELIARFLASGLPSA